MESVARVGGMSRLPTHPIRAGAQVEGTLEKMGVPRVAANLRIRREWKELVSGQWRDKARPLVLERECLVVEVSSQMDAALLRYGATSLAEQLNVALGARVVLRIKIKTAHPPEKTKYQVTDD